MAQTGEAGEYYNDRSGYQQQPQAGYPPPQGYGQPNYSNGYQQPPPTYGQNFSAPPTEEKQSFDATFKIQKPKWNDLWAGILLILTFLGFVAVSGLTIHSYAKFKGFSGKGINDARNDFSLNTNTLVLFAFVLVVAFVFSWAYFLSARAFTKFFIWLTGILNIVFAVATAVYYLYRHLWGAGIVFAIFAIFAIICFISWIPRIPFSVIMMQTCMDVARHHGHIFLVSFVGGLVSVAFAAWFSVTLVAVYVAYEPGSGSSTNPACGTNGSGTGSCSSGKVIGLLVFVTFAGYWISEWIKNTMHTTIAGVYGSWYFCAGKPGGMPSGATRGAFRRSITYSFGSISFGSLIVALINMLRQACSIAQRQEASEGNPIAAIMFCVLGK